MGIARRYPSGGCGHPPDPHPHCVLRCLTTISVVGLVCVGPDVRSGTNGEVRRAPPGGCAASPRNPPRIRQRRPRKGVDDSTSVPSAPGRGRVLAHFLGGGAGEAGARGAEGPPNKPKAPRRAACNLDTRRRDVSAVGPRQGARTRAFLGGGAGEAGAPPGSGSRKRSRGGGVEPPRIRAEGPPNKPKAP